jgi:sugar phosphate isomerase/epimerase
MMQRKPEGISRRRFIESGAAAIGLAALPGLSAAPEEKSKEPFGNFTVGAQSYCFREFTGEQAVKRTRDLGLHFIEFYPGPHLRQNSKPEAITAVKRLCAQYEVLPRTYGVVRFRKDHEYNRKVFELGRVLGIKAFSADPDPDSFDSLDKLVEQYQIAVGIHPHGPDTPLSKGTLHRWYSAEIILQAVKNHHAMIGSCLDTGHLIRAGLLGKPLDPVQQIRLMGARNFGIHLKDIDTQKDVNVVFGKGALDLPGVLRALRDVGFKGLLSIEYEAHPEDPSPDMRACVDVLKEAVRKLS